MCATEGESEGGSEKEIGSKQGGERGRFRVQWCQGIRASSGGPADVFENSLLGNPVLLLKWTVFFRPKMRQLHSEGG